MLTLNLLHWISPWLWVQLPLEMLLWLGLGHIWSPLNLFPVASVFTSLSWVSINLSDSLCLLILYNPHQWLCPESLRKQWWGWGLSVFSSYCMHGVYICNLKLVISFCYKHFLNWQGFYKLKIHGNKENSSFSSSLSFVVDSQDLGQLFPFLELLSHVERPVLWAIPLSVHPRTAN